MPDFLKPYDINLNNVLDAEEVAKILELPQPRLEKLTQDTTYYLLREITAASKNARNKLVPSEGISFDEFRTLAFLAQAEKSRNEEEPRAISQKDIADELHLATSTVTNLLDKMDVARGDNAEHHRGWITRIENPKKRTEKVVSLTDEGRARILSARKDYKKATAQGLLGSMDLGQLLALLSSLLAFNVALDPKHDLNPDISDVDDVPSESKEVLAVA